MATAGIILRDITELIRELRRIDLVCKKAKYSLDTVHQLLEIANELKEHARDIQQCCY